MQPGHTLALSIDVEQRELAHNRQSLCTWSAQLSQWADDFIDREKFPSRADGASGHVPRKEYKTAEMNYLLENKSKSSRCSFF